MSGLDRNRGPWSPTEVLSRKAPCVFISYRHEPLDIEIARDVHRLLEDLKLRTFFDEHDGCLQKAEQRRDGDGRENAEAKCIEEGLNRSSALLGVITRKTFDSPWIPYEIGSARGRKTFQNPLGMERAEGWGQTILIAHLIHQDVRREDVPSFVWLGYPIADREHLTRWAKALLALHGLPIPHDTALRAKLGRSRSLSKALPSQRDLPR